MKQTFVRLALTLVTVLLVASACASDSGGGDSGSSISGGGIEISDARYRLSRNDLGSAYLDIFNGTSQTLTLEAVSAAGVGRIELHESSAADDGTMTMQARPEGFMIRAGETVSLQPGGKHLMLIDPSMTGGDLALDLDFGAEVVSVVAAFDAAASAAAANSVDDDGHDMGNDDSDDMDNGSMDNEANG